LVLGGEFDDAEFPEIHIHKSFMFATSGSVTYNPHSIVEGVFVDSNGNDGASCVTSSKNGPYLMSSAYAFARAVVWILLGICIVVTSTAANAESLSDRLTRAGYFAASTRNAAFPVRDSKGSLAILLVDFDTGKRKKLGIKGAHLLSPYLSPDGTRLLFVRHPFGEGGREIVSCDTESLRCRSVLKSEGSISSPTEISDGRILYVESPKVPGLNGEARYHRDDFWLLGQTGRALQLTNMRLYQISSIGVTESAVYFSGDGPPRDNPIIPKSDPDLTKQSNIFKLPFDRALGNIESPSRPLEPLFLDYGRSRSPGVSRDGSLIAFLRTVNLGNYRYDLVIEDQESHETRLMTAPGLGFSRPVVVGKSVYANVINEDRLWVQVAEPGQRTMKRLAEVTDASINSVETTDIKFEQ
jgi:dipeptidyl aminopeptidase/acylaminoacyl peptidase